MAKTQETFQNNNFAYAGGKDSIHVTLFENNHLSSLRPNAYEATFVYLIRRQGELTIHTERQVLGLFSEAMWDEVFRNAAITMQKTNQDGICDPYLLDDREYPLTVFVGQKV